MVLIMYHKYWYFVKYIWSKLKVVDFLGENDSFLGTDGVSSMLFKENFSVEVQRGFRIYID